MKAQPPSIYVQPEINDVKVLEFHKVDQILEQSKPASDRLRAELDAVLDGYKWAEPNPSGAIGQQS